VSRNEEKDVLTAISYLHDEGFLECFLDNNGTPRVRLTTELRDARKAIHNLAKKIKKQSDTADWWKE